MEYDKDGNLVVGVAPQAQPQQLSGQVGLMQQANMMYPQNKPNTGAQFLIGLIFPWILFGGFAILAGMSQAVLYETNDGYDYYDGGQPHVVLAVGNGQNTEFSGVHTELVGMYEMCGDIRIYNWYPPPEPYVEQWIEIGALTQNYHGSYTECERGDGELWLFREKSDGTREITEVGQINKNNDGVFELSFDSAPPDKSKIEYQYWLEDDYDYDDGAAEELIAMACCMLPGIIYIGAIAVGYAKGFVAFSNGALISTIGSIAIFFVGCFAVLLTMGW